MSGRERQASFKMQQAMVLHHCCDYNDNDDDNDIFGDNDGDDDDDEFNVWQAHSHYAHADSPKTPHRIVPRRF